MGIYANNKVEGIRLLSEDSDGDRKVEYTFGDDNWKEELLKFINEQNSSNLKLQTGHNTSSTLSSSASSSLMWFDVTNKG
jgi:hypothetical protein